MIPKGKPGGRLWDWDPERGIAQYWHWDAQRGVGIIEMVQDTRSILEKNKALQANEDERIKESPGMGLRHLGSVPITMLMDWIKEGKISEGPLHMVKDEKFIRRKLNDPKYSKLKTTSKRV